MAYDYPFKWIAGFLHSLSRSMVAPVTDARSAERSDAGAPATTRFDEAAKTLWLSLEGHPSCESDDDLDGYHLRSERDLTRIAAALHEAAQSGSVGVDVKECQRQMPSEDEISDAACKKFHVAIRQDGETSIDGQVRLISARMAFIEGAEWALSRLESNGEGEDNT